MTADDGQVPVIVSAVEIVDGKEVPIGEPQQRAISRDALNLLHGATALDDRRQRAREAFHDGSPTIDNDVIDEVHAAAEAAIETATRVRVDDDILAAGYPSALTERDRALCRPLLIAAFEAAGFEVEQ